MRRDLLSRIIFGSRITLIVSITAVFIGDLIGFVWGIASGCLGQRFDLISQRVVDVLMSFPGLILALLLLVVLGAGLVTVNVAISVTRIPSATRITRAVVLSIKETSCVEAARMVGASNMCALWCAMSRRRRLRPAWWSQPAQVSIDTLAFSPPGPQTFRPSLRITQYGICNSGKAEFLCEPPQTRRLLCPFRS